MKMATEKFIAKHLTCAVCQDEYQDPRRLSCQHVYCLKCLQAHMNSTAGFRFIRQRTVRFIGFNCPECRKTIRVPRPNEPRDVWASQITRDYKTAGIQADIREGTFGLSEPSPKVAEDPKREKKTEKDTNEISSRITRIQVRTNTSEGRLTPSHNTSEEQPDTTSQDDVKQRKKSDSAMKGEMVRVISPQAGDMAPEYYDLAVLVQGESRIIVTLDFQKNELVTFTLNESMDVVNTNSHNLGCKPWRICKISKNEVVVTVSEPDGVLMCTIDSGVTTDRLFPTKKRYDGITMLSGRRFVLTTKDNVDIVKYDGTVLQEFKVSAPHVKYTDNSYVTCISHQNIVVTDCGGKTASCVTQDGKIVWRKKMSPLGVTCDDSGSIYFVDNDATVVYQFTSRGRFVSKVVEQSENFSKPSGIAVDGAGYMYVICDFKNITVWKLCPPREDTST